MSLRRQLAFFSPFSAQALRYLSQSMLLDEQASPTIIRLATFTISSAVFAFIFWAAITPIHEIASAAGEVIPSSYVQVVQHLEGGIVKQILVREGEQVEAGQLLMRLDGAGSDRDLSELAGHQRTLKLQAERLRAFVEGRVPDFTVIENATPREKADQTRIFNDMLRARNAEQEVIRAQIKQKEEVIPTLKGQMLTLDKNLRLAQEYYELQKQLSDKGLANRSKLLEREERLNSARGARVQVDQDIAQAKQALEEYTQRLATLDAQARDQANQQLDQVSSEIAQNDQALKKSQDKVDRLEVHSPVKGIVKGLMVNTIGAVVGSGQKLLEIVPLEDTLVVEARVKPSEVGHLKPGQDVQVRVDAFDYARYGAIPGTLTSISATTFTNEQQQSFYRARVALSRSYVGAPPNQSPILPGMTVDADIITGEKTVLAYLMKPVHVAAHSALTER